MRREVREELKRVFEPPKPQGKRAFLRALAQPRISILRFALTQLGYIRRWSWAVSVMIFAGSVAASVWSPSRILGIVSAFAPLLALTVVTESGRSESYEMAELEMATRFSLRSVLLARLGLLGLANLVMFFLLLPVVVWRQELGVLRAGLYILLPYLLTAFAGLWVLRRFRGREAVYCCVGVAACISFLAAMLFETVPRLYQPDMVSWWLAGVLALSVGTVRQCTGIVRDSLAA